jgi:hypothetical protein
LPSWFPGTGQANRAKSLQGIVSRFHEWPVEELSRKIVRALHIIAFQFDLTLRLQAAGTAEPCFLEAQLRQAEENKELREIVKYTAGSLFGGGEDTVCLSFFVPVGF